MNIPFQNGDKVYFIARNEVYEGHRVQYIPCPR